MLVLLTRTRVKGSGNLTVLGRRYEEIFSSLRGIAGDGSLSRGGETEETVLYEKRERPESSEGSVWCTEVDCTGVTLNRIT